MSTKPLKPSSPTTTTNPSSTSITHSERLLWLALALLVAAAAVIIDRHFDVSKKDIDYKVDWITMKKTEEQTLPQFGLMRMEWQVPIYHVSVSSVYPDVQGLTSRVAKVILQRYEKMKQENADSLSDTDFEANGVNQVFFEWQTQGGWNLIKQDKDVQYLIKFFHFATDTYLANIGKTREEVVNRKKDIHAWATVNQGCIGHLQHTHPNHLVSGVFYVSMPKRAGPILFRDPRGPLQPFDDYITIHPKVGELLLFPSWLPHEVTATPDDEPRISIAFNMAGTWEETTGVSVQFPLEK
jgi:uncharacterized protein (TIGR02466 family)